VPKGAYLSRGTPLFPGLAGRKLAAGSAASPGSQIGSGGSLLLDTTALRGQLCRAALLRIASSEA